MPKIMQKIGRALLVWMLALSEVCVQAQTVSIAPSSGNSLLSTRVIYLSKAGITADGTTDQATALQTIFNTNSAGGSLEVVNDLTGILVTSGNTVYSNTTVRTLAGGHWKLAVNGGKPILSNASPVASLPAGKKYSSGTTSTGPTLPTDHDIQIIGGDWDGNDTGGGANGTPGNSTTSQLVNSSGVLVSIFGFFGVTNLTMTGCCLHNSPCYGFFAANVSHVRISDCSYIAPYHGSNGGHDGFHFCSPVNDAHLSHMTIDTDDDAICFNVMDGHVDNATGNISNNTSPGFSTDIFGGVVGYGPSADLSVDGVVLNGACCGVRLLVGLGIRADWVSISHVSGSCTSYAVFLDGGTLFSNPTYGTVTVDDVRVQSLAQDAHLAKAGFHPTIMLIQSIIENLSINHISRDNPYDGRPLILLRGNAESAYNVTPANVQNMHITNMVSNDGTYTGGSTDLIHLDNGAQIGQLVADVNWTSAAASPGNVVGIDSGATVTSANLSGVLPNGALEFGGAGTAPISAYLNTASLLTVGAVVVAPPTTRFSDGAPMTLSKYALAGGTAPTLIGGVLTYSSGAAGTSDNTITGLSFGSGNTLTVSASKGILICFAVGSSVSQCVLFQWQPSGLYSIVQQGGSSGNGNLYSGPSADTSSGNKTIVIKRTSSTAFTVTFGGTNLGTFNISGGLQANTAVHLYLQNTDAIQTTPITTSVTSVLETSP